MDFNLEQTGKKSLLQNLYLAQKLSLGNLPPDGFADSIFFSRQPR